MAGDPKIRRERSYSLRVLATDKWLMIRRELANIQFTSQTAYQPPLATCPSKEWLHLDYYFFIIGHKYDFFSVWDDDFVTHVSPPNVQSYCFRHIE